MGSATHLTHNYDLCDAAGAEQFEALSRMYYHGSRAAIVCFDASRASSFNKLKFWVRLAHLYDADAMIGTFSCCM